MHQALCSACNATTAAGCRAAARGWRVPARRAASSARLLPSYGEQRRALAAAAAAPLGATGTSSSAPSGLGPEDDVEVAVLAACRALNRQPGAAEAALVARLREEWYDTALAVAELDDATAKQLGVPLRLRSKLAELLQQGAAASSVGSTLGAGSTPGSMVRQQQQQGQPQQQPQQQQEQQERQQPVPLFEGLSLPAQARALVDSMFNRAQGKSSEPSSSSSNVRSLDRSSFDSDDGADDEEEVEEVELATGDGGAAAASQPGSSGSGQGAGAVDNPDAQFALPIEERRCPPLRRFGNSFSEAPAVSKRGRPEPYALKESEQTAELRAEFAAFHAFLTQRFFGQIGDPIQPVTAAKYADHMRGLLGWLHRQRGVPLDALSFRAALPSAQRHGVALVFDYIQWLHATRSISVRTEGLVVRSAGAAAKFLYRGESKLEAHSGEKPYSDLEIIKELRRMSNDCKKASRVAARSSDESLKWLDWPAYLEVVRELRRECAALTADGKPRSRKAVASSLQKYLIFAIFSCVPDRQRTLRELEVGRTLVRSGERWVIKHGPGDYKTGRAYGERPPLVLAPHIYPELEAYMTTWRQELQPSHNFLFTQEVNGQPLTDKSLYKLFWTTSYRISGKKANPHSIRDSIVTYLRGGGATEQQLEALAIYMGHSIEMQRDVYDRRTVAQKVEPAVELLESLNARAATSPQ